VRQPLLQDVINMQIPGALLHPLSQASDHLRMAGRSRFQGTQRDISQPLSLFPTPSRTEISLALLKYETARQTPSYPLRYGAVRDVDSAIMHAPTCATPTPTRFRVARKDTFEIVHTTLIGCVCEYKAPQRASLSVAGF